MRYATRLAMFVPLAFSLMATSLLLAEDGVLKVTVQRAEAEKKESDYWTNNKQDFFVRMAIDLGAPVLTPMKKDRDRPAWDSANTMTKLVPLKNQRFFDLYFELMDDDSCPLCPAPPAAIFDISPQNGPPPAWYPAYNPTFANGSQPHLMYDVCTGKMSVKSVGGSSPIYVGANAVTVSGVGTTPGNPDYSADLSFAVTREPANWLPEDIAVSKVSMVQAVYDPSRAVVDKPTSMRVDVDSTYPLPITAPLHGQMSDGYSTVFDGRTVTIAPGHNVYFLFDGATSPPFLPYKPIWANSGTLSGSARIDYTEQVSLNAPVQLMDCANLNNIGEATSLPLSRTQDAKVVYRRFDYTEDLDFITKQNLQDMFDREEWFRLAMWPLATLRSNLDIAPLDHDHGSSFPWVEPVSSMIWGSKLAFLSGIDRLVLAVRKDWFQDNAFRHQFIGNDISGLSLGPVIPRAVLAEDGHYGVAVHELGHSFSQTQHKCSNGGLAEDWFGLGCFDEYNHMPPDTNPYEALGFDVGGLIYPSGVHVQPSDGFPGIACPSSGPAGRDICAPNFMDAIPSGGYLNWIDALTFDDLLDRLRAGTDPTLLEVSGRIFLPQGMGDGHAPPPVFGMLDPFNYQALGIPDLPEAPLSQDGEVWSGTGAFRIRLRTPIGVRDYRFDVHLFDNDISPEVDSFFSLAVPFDPATTAVELVVPADLLALDCQHQYCPGNALTVAGVPRTPLPPGVANLRAGRDAAPPSAPPQPPVIGPGHDAVLAWNAGDPDSPDLRAAVIVWRQDPGGNPGSAVPMEADIAGGTLHIPQSALADTPGTYGGKVVVTDGVNTTELVSAALFTICVQSNGGVELCNGLDDDCDGVADNAYVSDTSCFLPGVCAAGNVGSSCSNGIETACRTGTPTGADNQCNGLDDDCDGLTDEGVARPGSPLVLAHRHAPLAGSIEMAWSAEPLAESYDVLYGNLGALNASVGNFTTSILGCVAENTAALQVVHDAVPTVGGAYFYLLRASNCAGPGTWDSGAASQVGSRDAEIGAAPGTCQP